jgi:hypothetical protein
MQLYKNKMIVVAFVLILAEICAYVIGSGHDSTCPTLQLNTDASDGKDL